MGRSGGGAETCGADARGIFGDTVRARKAYAAKMKVPRVYCEAWPHPRIVSPPWVGELVEIAGGEMVVPAGKRISDEDVAAAKPEVIVLAWAAVGEKSDPKQTYEVSARSEVPAVRDGEFMWCGMNC